MPSYLVQIKAYGWFEIRADDDDDAEKVADELTKHGPPIGAEFDWCEVDNIEQDVDAE